MQGDLGAHHPSALNSDCRGLQKGYLLMRQESAVLMKCEQILYITLGSNEKETSCIREAYFKGETTRIGDKACHIRQCYP